LEAAPQLEGARQANVSSPRQRRTEPSRRTRHGIVGNSIRVDVFRAAAAAAGGVCIAVKSVISRTSGHEMAVPVQAAIFLDINALVIAVVIAAFLLHEVKAVWDVSYATQTRALRANLGALTRFAIWIRHE
jgi:hypothetical protein